MTSAGVTRTSGIDPVVAVKAPCVCATTISITLSGAQTIDGIAVAETTPATRVLVKTQTDQTENGVYDAKGTAWVRSDDFDGPRDAVSDTLVSVDQGMTFGNTTFRVDATNPIVFGTSAINFTTTQTLGSAQIQYRTTIAVMIGDASLVSGNIIETLESLIGTGFDGGNRYEVGVTFGAADGVRIVDLDNGLQARALFPHGVFTRQYKVAADSSTDNHTQLQLAFTAMVEGSVLNFSTKEGGNTTVDTEYSDTLLLPVVNNIKLVGLGRNFGKIVQTGVGKDGIDAGATFPTPATNGLEIEKLWVSTTLGVGRYGVDLSGTLKCNVTSLYLEGFTAGIWAVDSITSVIDKCFFAGGTDGIATTSGFNNSRLTNCEMESPARYGMNIGGTGGLATPASFYVGTNSFQACVKGAIWFIASTNTTYNNNYFEGNHDGTAGTFDIKIGTSPVMRGGEALNNHFKSTTNVNHFPMRIGNWTAGRVSGNDVDDGSHYISFITTGTGTINNCIFGAVQMNGTRDRSEGSGATYENISPKFVNDKNRMLDYETFPNGGQNFFTEEIALDWALAGTGTATLVRAGSGSTPAEHNGRPVAELDQTSGTNAEISKTFTLSATQNTYARGKWCTFLIDVLVVDATDKSFELTLIGAGSTGATVTYTAKASDEYITYAVSAYIDAAGTSILAKVNSTEVSTLEISNHRLFVGMDFTTMEGLSGAPLWRATAAPTTGTWARGDIVWRSDATAAGTPGWDCTTAGTSGTFKALANVAA